MMDLNAQTPKAASSIDVSAEDASVKRHYALVGDPFPRQLKQISSEYLTKHKEGEVRSNGQDLNVSQTSMSSLKRKTGYNVTFYNYSSAACLGASTSSLVAFILANQLCIT